MAVSRVSQFFNYQNLQKLNFSTSCCLKNIWRKKQNLEPNPSTYGPLTNLPDYSYVDGRPVPLSKRKKIKLELQKKYCERIVELSNELDIGLENYYKKIEEEKQYRENILKNKLKPKGSALLKNDSKALNKNSE